MTSAMLSRSLETATAEFLLAACAKGEPAAREEIFRRHKDAVHAAVRKFRLSEADRADAAQNTWLRLFEHADTIREPDRLGGWLAITARRECLALIRANRREFAAEHDWAGQASTDPTPETASIDACVRHAVRSAVADLTGRAAPVIDALFFQPPSTYAELSAQLGIRAGSIGPARGRAIRALRARLQEIHN